MSKIIPSFKNESLIELRMETMRFRTNAKCQGCLGAIANKLNKIVNEGDWLLDLKSPDKVLEVTTDLPRETIIATVAEAGFKAEPMP